MQGPALIWSRQKDEELKEGRTLTFPPASLARLRWMQAGMVQADDEVIVRLGSVDHRARLRADGCLVLKVGGVTCAGQRHVAFHAGIDRSNRHLMHLSL